MISQISNRKIILISAIIAGISLIFGILNFERAFPEIGINFKLSRHTALNSANDFLLSRGFELDGYKQTIIFSYDQSTKLFLDKELGVERTTRLTQDSIDLWHWEARFFKPLEKLEYTVYIDPAGRVRGFERSVLESDAGLLIEMESALALAEAFIAGPMGEDLGQWELVETEKSDHPNRTDYQFTYEQMNFKVSGAAYRMFIEVQGAKVGKFQRFLKVPEVWQREYSGMRSQNRVFGNIATFIYILISIVIFVHFIRNIRDRQIHWKSTAVIGGVMAFASAVMVINSLPLSLSEYITTESYSAFLSNQILMSILIGIGSGLMIFVLLSAGERLYRHDHPKLLFIPNIFTRRGFRSSEFFQATLMGYLLAAFHIGFVVLFYVAGKKFGFWSPAEVQYDNAVSTILPWIFPLAASMMAALSEEFWFRLFGISFFKKLLRSTTLAIIVQAVIWGFLHSNYPQQPGYVRGIEVGIIGVIAGFVMLRFGVWATLTWHFVIDAIFIGMFLFKSDNTYFWVSGLIVCGGLLIPAAIAGVAYLRKRSFEKVNDLWNRNVDRKYSERLLLRERTKPVPSLAALESPAYQSLSRNVRRNILIVGLLGFLLILTPSPDKFGDDFKPHLDAEDAVEIASSLLLERYGINPQEYIIGVRDNQQNSVKLSAKLSYLKKFGDQQLAEEIFYAPDQVESPCWRVSFKRELDPQYYIVKISMIDATHSITHILPESAPGADLPPADAEIIALRQFEELEDEPGRYQLIEKSSEKLDRRRDHLFVWETIEPVAGEAKIRRNILVKGDEVLPLPGTLKIPEKWQRTEQKRGLRWIIFSILRIIVLLGLAVVAFLGFGKRLKSRKFYWRSGLFFSSAVLILGIASMLNDKYSFWFGYVTSYPLKNFLTIAVTGMGSQVVLTSLFVGILFVVADTLSRGENPSHHISFRSSGRKTGMEDGVRILFGILGCGFGLSWLLSSLTSWLNLPVHSFNFSLPGNLTDHFLPLGFVYDAFLSSLILSSMIMIGFMILSIAVKSQFNRILILLIISIAAAEILIPPEGSPTSGELAWIMVQSIIIIFAGYYILKHWIQGRFWVMITAAFSASLIKSGVTFLSWGETPYRIEGWLLLVIAVVPMFCMIYGALRADGRDQPVR